VKERQKKKKEAEERIFSCIECVSLSAQKERERERERERKKKEF
jgi:hypothetical protein